MSVHRLYYDNDTCKDNPISGAMRAKGWTDFSISGSRYQNEYSGYWVESDTHSEIDGKWIGQTYKDALWTIRNDFPKNNGS